MIKKINGNVSVCKEKKQNTNDKGLLKECNETLQTNGMNRDVIWESIKDGGNINNVCKMATIIRTIYDLINEQ